MPSTPPTPPVTPEYLDELEAQHNASTPGEWVVMIGGYLIKAKHDCRYPEGQAEFIVADTINFNNPSFAPIASCNAKFIAAAHNAIPALIAEIRRLRAELERWTAPLADWNNPEEDAAWAHLNKEPHE